MAASGDRHRLVQRLLRLRDGLANGLIERETEVRLALLAALAGEHLLLVGPPGTAKSQLARRLHLAFTGAGYFERLLTRFSVPEELFGPLSIKALQDDRYLRQTAGYLPTASVAFVDEVFKANSAILNALLTLLNERCFDNGAGREAVPLLCLVGASNELPREGEELAVLGALYDRFLLRRYVAPVSDEGFSGLLALQGEPAATIAPADRLEPGEVRQIQAAAAAVVLGPPVLALLGDLRRHLAGQGIACSDRRWRKIARLLQIAAYSDGRDEVSLLDGWLLPHVTWERPEQCESLMAWFEHAAFLESDQRPEYFTPYVSAWEEAVLAAAPTPGAGVPGQGATAAPAAGEPEPTRSPLTPSPLALPPRDPQAQLAELRPVFTTLQAAVQRLESAREDLPSQARDRLWLPPDFAATARGHLGGNLQQLRDLCRRLERVELALEARAHAARSPSPAACPPSPAARPPSPPARTG